MQVLSFLAKIYICLITNKYLMSSITETYGRCICLVTIANRYSMEIPS